MRGFQALGGSIPSRMEKAKTLMAWICTDAFSRRSWVAGCVALAIMLLAACTTESPEARLRQRFAEMQAAVEDRRTSDFMDGVSADFTGAGGMDRAALHNLLRARTLGNANIGATTGTLDVQVNGDTATVKFSLLLTGGSRVLPDQVRTLQVTSGWRQQDGEWKVYYAEWE